MPFTPFFHFGPSISGLPPPRLSIPHIKENTGPVAGPFAQGYLEKPAWEGHAGGFCLPAPIKLKAGTS